ncbi:hypothetical protein BJY17_002759 [Agromyces hippuratus]|uniref:Uncharacterized protein n=1 Tax=Agromyces hippuratus TaxID=286438 RepID=A0A852WUM1_9MICO|nr:hypothetical protein [Agromyces hippuratus]NYG22012.1 hypothetical protein [Agromyces hippuratus]
MTVPAEPAKAAGASGVSGAPDRADGPDPRDLRLASRYGMLLRTPELPMAFSFTEFARGAGLAWLGFQALFSLGYASTGVAMAFASLAQPDRFSSFESAVGYVPAMLLFSFGYAMPWSIGALMLVGGPAAWLLGRSLRRVRAMRWHLVGFAVLGLVVGLATSVIATATMQFPGSQGSIFVLIATPATTVAVAFGWWRTASWALRDDVGFRAAFAVRHP